MTNASWSAIANVLLETCPGINAISQATTAPVPLLKKRRPMDAIGSTVSVP